MSRNRDQGTNRYDDYKQIGSLEDFIGLFNVIRNIFPLTSIVHLGAGKGVGALHWWHELDLVQAMVIDAEGEKLEWAKRLGSLDSQYVAEQFVVHPIGGKHLYYRASNSSENGFTSIADLRAWWPGLSQASVIEVSTTPLAVLIDRYSIEDNFWLVVDFLVPGKACWVEGLCSAKPAVLIERSSIHAAEARGKRLRSSGYLPIGFLESNHPDLGYSIWVQDVRARLNALIKQEREAKAKALEAVKAEQGVNAKAMAECEELSKKHDEIAKARDEMARARDAALAELGSVEKTKLEVLAAAEAAKDRLAELTQTLEGERALKVQALGELEREREAKAKALEAVKAEQGVKAKAMAEREELSKKQDEIAKARDEMARARDAALAELGSVEKTKLEALAAAEAAKDRLAELTQTLEGERALKVQALGELEREREAKAKALEAVKAEQGVKAKAMAEREELSKKQDEIAKARDEMARARDAALAELGSVEKTKLEALAAAEAAKDRLAELTQTLEGERALKVQALGELEREREAKAKALEAVKAEQGVKAKAMAEREELSKKQDEIAKARDEMARARDAALAELGSVEKTKLEALAAAEAAKDRLAELTQTLEGERALKVQALGELEREREAKAKALEAVKAEQGVKAKAMAEREELSKKQDEIAKARDEMARARDAALAELGSVEKTKLEALAAAEAAKDRLAELTQTLEGERALKVQALGELEREREAKAKALEAVKAEQGVKAKAMAEREELSKKQDEIAKARDEMARARNAALAERDQAQKTLAAKQALIDRAERERDEFLARQQLMHDEMIKAEAQIELIKDVLLREPGL